MPRQGISVTGKTDAGHRRQEAGRKLNVKLTFFIPAGIRYDESRHYSFLLHWQRNEELSYDKQRKP